MCQLEKDGIFLIFSRNFQRLTSVMLSIALVNSMNAMRAGMLIAIELFNDLFQSYELLECTSSRSVGRKAGCKKGKEA